MRICRFTKAGGQPEIGLLTDDQNLIGLAQAGINRLHSLLELENLPVALQKFASEKLPRISLNSVKLCAPADHQEVWAAGVTYLRSKAARMEESEFSASAYDKVYVAERPEIFFKALPHKVVANGEAVGIRKDATWSVPEPELALVFNSRGQRVGYTIGNDMSSRDIESANLLYLPQAKTYDRSCALGPWITVGPTEAEARSWEIRVDIVRSGASVFSGKTAVSQIKRTFDELGGFLFRSQVFADGAVLLTGTGVVPPDSFTLQAADIVRIEITGIGVLENHVKVV